MTHIEQDSRSTALRNLDPSFAARPRRRRKKIHITARDMRVLETLVTRRVETIDALHLVAFPGVSRKRAQNRLGELTSAGYLDRRSVELPGQAGLQSVYFLGARGRTALQIRSNESAGWFATRHWKLDLSEPSIPHQIVTNRVCDWMGARAIPEHLLPPVRHDRSAFKAPKRATRPDAVYEAREARDGTALVWLEVDLGHYTKQRICEKVEAHMGARQARLLLIACPTKAREEWLVSVLVERFTGHIWNYIDVRTFDHLREGGAPNLDDSLRPSDHYPTMIYDHD